MRALPAITVLALAVSLPAQSDPGLAELCQQIAPTIRGTLSPGKALPLPDEKVLAHIADLVPGSGRIGDAALFAVTHAWPDDDDAEARLVRVPVGDDTGRQVVLVASVDGLVRGGAVVDRDHRLDGKASPFVAQFTGKNLPSPDDTVRRADFAGRIATVEASKEPADRALAALIDLRHSMVMQANPAASVMAELEQGRAPAAASVAEMRAAYVAIRARSAALGSLLGKGHERYEQISAGVLARIDDIARAGDAARRQALHKQLKGDCRDCHTLHADAFDGDFEEFAAGERSRRGFGGSPFLVGYDVAAVGLAAAEAQAFADACRRGALLLLARP